jgi:hypothetical protein
MQWKLARWVSRRAQVHMPQKTKRPASEMSEAGLRSEEEDAGMNSVTHL